MDARRALIVLAVIGLIWAMGLTTLLTMRYSQVGIAQQSNHREWSGGGLLGLTARFDDTRQGFARRAGTRDGDWRGLAGRSGDPRRAQVA